MPMFERRVLDKFEPTLTKQSFKEECDLNVVMKKFKKICDKDFLDQFQGYAGGQFGDFSEVVDYRSALDQVTRAKEVFGALPARVRARFENDPAFFLDFCQDPQNLKELRDLGLAKPEPTPPPVTPDLTGK